MTQPTNQQVLAVCDRFALAGGVTDVKVCGNGHINSTYIITPTGSLKIAVFRICRT